METKPDKQQTVTRLALCVVVAVAHYAAAWSSTGTAAATPRQ